MNHDNNRRSLTPGQRSSHDPIQSTTSLNDREAATHVMRDSIDRIYDQNPPHQEAMQAIAKSSENQLHQPNEEPASPYKKIHSDTAAHANTVDQWEHYHNSWQSYYQQYYERYYMHHLEASRDRLHQSSVSAPPSGHHTGAQPIGIIASSEDDGTEAVSSIRTQLHSQVRDRAEKFRGSRHFMPIMTAVVVGFLFVSLQFNRVFVAQVQAYVSPGAIESQNIIVDPTTDLKVGPEPRLIIPKINVDAPVVYGVGTIEEGPIQEALRDGVVHYPIAGASSLPGQNGNTVILGHSSNDVFDSGSYKFVFVQLDRLNEGDSFYAHYNGTRYTYSVTQKKVIQPNEISEIYHESDRPVMTLITCTPIGTALQRLIITAEQISPDPGAAKNAPDKSDQREPQNLPGNAPTIFEQLFS